MAKYQCPKCFAEYTRKIDFSKHKCDSAPDSKSKLIIALKSYLNILRDGEGLTGEKALRNMSYLLILKLLEPRINELFADFDFESNYENPDDARRLIQFSNLDKSYVDDLHSQLRALWDNALSVHPSTRGVYLYGRNFDIERCTTFKSLISKMVQLNLTEADYDVLGGAYEEVIRDIMTGKVLGQFFTPTAVKDIMIKLIDPRPGETMCDPTMGTGGFLISYMKHLRGQPAEMFKQCLYGKELEPDTYQLAMANVLISSGQLFEQLERGDSIREPIARKFDIVLANPPFGIKGLKYSSIPAAAVGRPRRNDYVPIMSDNAVSLFIQAIIYMLKVGGRCAVVLPDGQDLFSKTNATLVMVREYLLRSCELREIIYLPAGIFTNTSIKTCIFYFYKRRDDALAVHDPKPNKREYKFCAEYSTAAVRFYEYAPSGNKFLVEATIEQLAKNSYSLNYAEYMATTAETFAVPVKTLGELFECKMGKYNSSDMDNIGDIPFYSCKSINPVGTHSNFSFDFPEYLLLICSGGSKNNLDGDDVGLGKCYYVKNKSACRAGVCALFPHSINLNIKYILHYLNINRIKTNKKAHFTTSLGTITLENLKNIEIPIPSLEVQAEAVELLDELDAANRASADKIAQLKRINKSTTIAVRNYPRKTLGDICDFMPKSKRLAGFGTDIGQYPFYTSSQICKKYCDVCDYDGEYVIIGTGGNANIKYGTKFSCSADNIILRIGDCVQTKYLYYYISNNIELLQAGFIGVGLQHISKEYIKNIKIPIPPMELQAELVEICEQNDELIRQLEAEIVRNKKMMKIILDGATHAYSE